MSRLCRTALLFWMSLFEATAAVFGLHGLLISHARLRRALTCVVPVTAAQLWQNRPHSIVALLITLLPAVVLHLVVACLRNRHLNPRLRLLPGFYPDRQITRIEIPTAEGGVPALHIEPLNGARAAVCVAHGSGCNKTFYAWELADTLIERGLAVVLIDLDGHGESPRPQAFPAILHNIIDPVAWLRQRYERVGVVGMSLGGCVAARAVAEGAAADALVIIEAPPKLEFTRRDVWREAVYLLQPAVLRLLREGSPCHVVRAWESPRIRASISTWDLIDKLDLIGSLQNIVGTAATTTHTCPLLLIYAGRDAIVKPAQAALVRQALPPDVPMHILAGASHLSLPIDPRALRLLGDWLAEHIGGSIAASQRVDPMMR